MSMMVVVIAIFITEITRISLQTINHVGIKVVLGLTWGN
jgi:hypothetical protein